MSQVPDDDLVEIDIDPNFDFTDLSKRTTKPVINTEIEGGSTSGVAQDPLTFGSSGIGDPFKSITDFFGGILSCNFVGIPCWILILAVIILILVAIIKRFLF